MDTIMVMDVGNTNTAIGVYAGATLKHQWRIATMRERTADELGVLIKGLCRDQGFDTDSLNGLVIGSVVPQHMNALEQMCQRYFHCDPLVVGPGIKTGLVIKYDNPRDVGADRIANAVAALHEFIPPLIVIDFGTATTFCVLDASGTYIGGAIAPGIQISTDALVQRAAKLPRIELSRPRHVVGRNTISSMQSGVIYGFAGQVDGLVERIQAEVGGTFNVVATGGLAELVSPVSRAIGRVVPNLTLDGLRILWNLNR